MGRVLIFKIAALPNHEKMPVNHDFRLKYFTDKNFLRFHGSELPNIFALG